MYLAMRIYNSSVKLLICDMVGTTINEHDIVYKTLLKTIRGYNIYVRNDDVKNWYGYNKSEVLNHYISNDEEYKHNRESIFPQMLHSFEKELRTNYFDNISLIDPTLPDVFQKIRENGIKIALNTEYSCDIQKEIIDTLNMNDIIDGYISSEEVNSGKPNPDMIFSLMKKFDIDNPLHVVKVGDTVNDILEGKNAKCQLSIGVTTGTNTSKELYYRGAQYVIPSIIDIDKCNLFG